ncbi:hypothetical protein GCM10028810_55050 [Spirosoma litoris]
MISLTHFLGLGQLSLGQIYEQTIMTIRLKKDATPKQIKEALDKIKPPTGQPLDVSRFSGKIKWGQDAVEYQRELRSE